MFTGILIHQQTKRERGISMLQTTAIQGRTKAVPTISHLEQSRHVGRVTDFSAPVIP